jgi:hypothetical protein
MRLLLCTMGALLLAACSPNASEPAIDGTYKADVATAKLSTKPDTFVVADGQYECSSCTPPYKIPADGQIHPVEGRDYWDAASVKVVDANTLEFTRYRKGTAVGTNTRVVSADGQMITWTSTSSDNAAGKPVTNSSKSKRSAPAPAGAHASSGSWVAVNEGAQIAEENLLVTLSMKGDAVALKTPTGESYEAKLGGPQVPVVGDKAGATVAVVAEGKGFKETGYVNGKAVVEITYTPVDAATMTMKVLNLRNNETEEFTFKKQ